MKRLLAVLMLVVMGVIAGCGQKLVQREPYEITVSGSKVSLYVYDAVNSEMLSAYSTTQAEEFKVIFVDFALGVRDSVSYADAELCKAAWENVNVYYAGDEIEAWTYELAGDIYPDYFSEERVKEGAFFVGYKVPKEATEIKVSINNNGKESNQITVEIQ